MFNFENEDDLKADGFVLTVNKFHTGLGDGKVYEKIVEGGRVFFGVDADGVVTPWTPASAAVVVDVLPPAVEPVVEPETAEPVVATDEDQPKVEDAD